MSLAIPSPIICGFVYIGAKAKAKTTSLPENLIYFLHRQRSKREFTFAQCKRTFLQHNTAAPSLAATFSLRPSHIERKRKRSLSFAVNYPLDYCISTFLRLHIIFILYRDLVTITTTRPVSNFTVEPSNDLQYFLSLCYPESPGARLSKLITAQHCLFYRPVSNASCKNQNVRIGSRTHSCRET